MLVGTRVYEFPVLTEGGTEGFEGESTPKAKA
jgi:hypothetical protein